MPTLPITVPNVFANATSNIALSLLDADFQTVAQAINGIGNGSTPLTNVTITGGTVSGVVVSSVPTSGQCRFAFISATQCALVPYSGQYIQIAGVLRAIPAAGVTLGNGGLTANTGYYVYVYNSGGTLALEASTTAAVPDTTPGNVGIVIKSGDNSRSMVGRVFMNNDGQFSQGAADSGNAIVHGVASYFNRSMNMTGVGISGTISGGSPVAISGAIRLSSWEDEAVVLAVSGYCINQGATGANASIQVFINGAFTNWQSFMSLPAGAAGSIAASFIAGPQSSSYYQILAQCPNPLLTSGSFWITTNK